MSYNLQQRLDAFVSGECSPDALVQELSALCEATPDCAWDVLSLVDQYYRRGKLSSDLFRTVRYRIERHVLGVRDSDTIGELSAAPVGTETAVRAVRGVAVAMQGPAAPPKELAGDIRALRIELLSARGTAQRYRKRLAILADFAHRTRSALANTQRELGVSRSQAIELLNARGTMQRYRRRLAVLADFAHRTRSALANTQRELGVSRSQAMDYCDRLRSSEWRRAMREQINGAITGTSATRARMRLWRPVRSSQAVALA